MQPPSLIPLPEGGAGSGVFSAQPGTPDVICTIAVSFGWYMSGGDVIHALAMNVAPAGHTHGTGMNTSFVSPGVSGTPVTNELYPSEIITFTESAIAGTLPLLISRIETGTSPGTSYGIGRTICVSTS